MNANEACPYSLMRHVQNVNEAMLTGNADSDAGYPDAYAGVM